MIIGKTSIVLLQGDITRQAVDVIVNAANSSLCGGGGVDGAIHRAGGPSILEQCREIVQRQGRCPAGDAVLTGAGQLSAKYIVHTVGPRWSGGDRAESGTLRRAYLSSLKLADSVHAEAIAFPSISTGAYGYPVEEAADVALSACLEYCAGDTSLREIRFTLFSEGDYGVYVRTLQAKEKKLTAGQRAQE